MRFFNTAGVENRPYPATMYVTMDIRIGCPAEAGQARRHLFLRLGITEHYLLYEKDVYKGLLTLRGEPVPLRRELG